MTTVEHYTCGYCESHVWADEEGYHVCIKNEMPGKMPCNAEKCHAFRTSMTGRYASNEAIADG
jgi:hypothetical protein